MRSTFLFDRIDPRSALPEPGDLLASARCGYRVLALRSVSSRGWHDRWRCDVEKVGDLPVRPEWVEQSIDRFGACSVVETEGYIPGEGPADVARRFNLPTEPPASDVQLALEALDVAPIESDAEGDLSRSEVRYLRPAPATRLADIRARHFGGATTTKENP